MNTVKIKQTNEGFKLESPLNEIPLDIVEHIVNTTTSVLLKTTDVKCCAIPFHF